MIEYKVHTTYTLTYESEGLTPFRTCVQKVIAENKEAAKEISWNSILSQNCFVTMVSQSARTVRSRD